MKNENQTDVAFEELKARNLRAVRLRTRLLNTRRRIRASFADPNYWLSGERGVHILNEIVGCELSEQEGQLTVFSSSDLSTPDMVHILRRLADELESAWACDERRRADAEELERQAAC